MRMKTYLTHARIVSLDEVVDDAALLLEDGTIRAINPVSSASSVEIDLAGQILMPGMIDLHGDALEKEVEPRPNVFFPLHFAMSQADKRNAQVDSGQTDLSVDVAERPVVKETIAWTKFLLCYAERIPGAMAKNPSINSNTPCNVPISPSKKVPHRR